MVVEHHNLIWTKRSQQNMLTAYKFISEDSQVNARKVIADIIKEAEKTIVNPYLSN